MKSINDGKSTSRLVFYVFTILLVGVERFMSVLMIPGELIKVKDCKDINISTYIYRKEFNAAQL
jgi:hypothetical protein